MIDSLRQECVYIGDSLNSKEDALKKIASLAKKSSILDMVTEEDIFTALKEREQVSSTGLEKGLAIPHCSFEGLTDFVTGLLLIPDGIDFDSFDGKPAKFIFFIVGPADKRNKHIKILSSISKLAMDDDLLEQLAMTKNASGAVSILSPSIDDSDTAQGAEKCQFIIYVQEEQLFLDVLEILTSRVEGDVSVFDSENAGTYLHKLPLFSSFWTDASKSFSKTIMAVIDKRLMNDTIRRINLVRPEDGSSMLISVTECLYTDGQVDF